jgi:hypothetical protein
VSSMFHAGKMSTIAREACELFHRYFAARDKWM